MLYFILFSFNKKTNKQKTFFQFNGHSIIAQILNILIIATLIL